MLYYSKYLILSRLIRESFSLVSRNRLVKILGRSCLVRKFASKNLEIPHHLGPVYKAAFSSTARLRGIACAHYLTTGIVFSALAVRARVIAQTRSMHRMRNVGAWIGRR